MESRADFSGRIWDPIDTDDHTFPKTICKCVVCSISCHWVVRLFSQFLGICLTLHLRVGGRGGQECSPVLSSSSGHASALSYLRWELINLPPILGFSTSIFWTCSMKASTSVFMRVHYLSFCSTCAFKINLRSADCGLWTSSPGFLLAHCLSFKDYDCSSFQLLTTRKIIGFILLFLFSLHAPLPTSVSACLFTSSGSFCSNEWRCCDHGVRMIRSLATVCIYSFGCVCVCVRMFLC